MHELTIRISRAFCRGVFPQLNGDLEADTALAVVLARNSMVSWRQIPRWPVTVPRQGLGSGRLQKPAYFFRLSGAASGGEALGFCRSP
ncbi:MAG: hypothetical protein LBB49_01030, partial [Gracilibacteraceae bacterium]|nr:hypothetical protein [Gracilibacteraceae bacterium]